MYFVNKHVPFQLAAIGTLTNDKILDWSKLKALADDKIDVTEKLKFVLGRVENTVVKGENAGYQHFLNSPQCFQKVSFLGVVKSRDCVVKRVENIVGKGEMLVMSPFLSSHNGFFCSSVKSSVVKFLTLPHMPIFGISSSTTKLIKIRCQKYGQIGIQLSDLIKNIMGKEEIACYKQFLLFPQCFQKLFVVDAS